MLHKALFLDRDGTLIVDRHYLQDTSGVELIAGVREALHRFIANGYQLFLFTNQSGVGRGMFTLETVHRCNERMLALLDLPSPGFTEICIATESPDMPAVYRKPSPRFILEMIAKHSLNPQETWMVGDRLKDVQAGLNAGIHTVLIQHGEVPAFPARVWRCNSLPDFCSKLVCDNSGIARASKRA